MKITNKTYKSRLLTRSDKQRYCIFNFIESIQLRSWLTFRNVAFKR